MIHFHQTCKSRNALHPAFVIFSEIDGNLTTGNDIIITADHNVPSELKLQQTLKTGLKY